MNPRKIVAGGDTAPLEPIDDGDGVATRPGVGTEGIPYVEWSDLDLVESLVDESGDAYAELYRRHSKSVRAAARMILQRDDRCEDVVAEVFVRLWFFPEKFDPSRGSLLAFLRLKARGRSIDLVRTETARKRREEAEKHEFASQNDDAPGLLIAAEDARAVREALALLPAIEREPISLAFFSGMTYKAVAAKLKLPEGTVKSRIRAGLSRLQTSDGLSLLREASGQRASPELPKMGGLHQSSRPN